MIFKHLFILICLFFSSLAIADEVTADSDSKIISRYVLENYSDMISDYVEVFVGHINCRYDFINETTFNDLADNAIRDITREAAEVIQASPNLNMNESDKSKIDYLASILALSIIDIHSSVLSKKISEKFTQGELTCKNSKERNLALYLKLTKEK